MSLHDLCIQRMVNEIKQLPPLLKEEILELSHKSIMEDAEKIARKKILDEIKRSALIVTNELTQRMIKSYTTLSTWNRPEYTKNMDEDIYQLFVEMSDNFVMSYHRQLIFGHTSNSENDYSNSENEYDSDSEIDY